MNIREQRDLFGGGILALVGLLFVSYTLANYELGTLNRMGPGMFPAALGTLLCLLGICQLIQAMSMRESFGAIRIRAPFFVLSSIAVFTVVLGFFGLLPAIVALVVISSLAERSVNPLSTVLLCAVLCLMAWLVFGVGLRLPVQMLRIPL